MEAIHRNYESLRETHRREEDREAYGRWVDDRIRETNASLAARGSTFRVSRSIKWSELPHEMTHKGIITSYYLWHASFLAFGVACTVAWGDPVLGGALLSLGALFNAISFSVFSGQSKHASYVMLATNLLLITTSIALIVANNAQMGVSSGFYFIDLCFMLAINWIHKHFSVGEKADAPPPVVDSKNKRIVNGSVALLHLAMIATIIPLMAIDNPKIDPSGENNHGSMMIILEVANILFSAYIYWRYSRVERARAQLPAAAPLPTTAAQTYGTTGP